MLKVTLLGTVLAAALCIPASAQTSKALISGIVTDSSGAAITNATSSQSPSEGIRRW